jgi:hypothetical protein
VTPDPAFLRAFDALPEGTFRGQAGGRAYTVSKTALADGRAQKLVAQRLGGGDYISLNLYRLASGAQLFPCEMPVEKVTAFVLALRPG